MPSFFEKLKKGMGVDENAIKKIKEEIPEEKVEERVQEEKEEERKEPVKKQKLKKEKPQTAREQEPKAEKIRAKEKQEPEKQIIMKEEVKNIMSKEEQKSYISTLAESSEKKTQSSGPGGQLAVDVYQTEEHVVIQSAIAGVKAEGLDISLEGDVVSISGTREKPNEDSAKSYFYQECYWGSFSRQIILSVEVDPARTEAALKEGILTIKIPKIDKDKKRKITVKE